jgi:ketosteroid isomerase-like protein
MITGYFSDIMLCMLIKGTTKVNLYITFLGGYTKMKNYLITTLLILFSSSFIPAQTSDIQNPEITNELITIVKIEFEAFKKKDASAWEKLIDDNAIFTGHEEGYKTKNQMIEEIKSAPAVYNSASEKYDGIVSRIYNDTAILLCHTTFTFRDSSGQLQSMMFKFTRVHVKADKGWKLVYHSAIPI